MKAIRPTYKKSCFSAVLFRNRLTPNRLFAAGCGRRACFFVFFAKIPKIRLFNPPKKWYDKGVLRYGSSAQTRAGRTPPWGGECRYEDHP